MNRKQHIEALLKEDASDPFMHYALALEVAKEGNIETANFQKDLELLSIKISGQGIISLMQKKQSKLIIRWLKNINWI